MLRTLLRSVPAVALLACLTVLTLADYDGGPPNPPDPPGRVYLIRGQGYFFSGGWRALRDRLRTAGVRADDVFDLRGPWVAEDILADRRAGRLRGPIVLVGHSRGGRQALYAAERLNREGVGVDLLLTTDVAIPPPVPANVREAINLYRTRDRLYPARPLRSADGSEARIENIDLDAAGSPVDPEGLHHLNITGSRAVQDYLYGRILGIMRAAR